MKKQRIQEMLERLLAEIEEEDIGISLFSTFYRDEEDLKFFGAIERDRVLRILDRLSEDSQRHKEWLRIIIQELAEKIYEE